MSIPDTALAVFVFLGLFAIIEYATYRAMEHDHQKRSIYRLVFMLAWTFLAFIHMWIVAPLLNLPPTAAIGLGLGILVIYIAGGLGFPVLKSVGVIGLYPFALVYEIFLVFVLLAEVVTMAASLVPIIQPKILSVIVPGDPRLQAVIGLASAASIVAAMYYNPQGENGYYYAAGHHATPSVDYEKFRQIQEEGELDREGTSDSIQQVRDSSTATETDGENRQSSSIRAPAKVSTTNKFDYNWTGSNLSFDDIGGYYKIKEQLAEDVLHPIRAAAQGDDRYARFGIEPSRGILFYGPPGTGKTLFARALAGELDVPFVELGPADITSKWINEGPKRVRQLFDEAASIGPRVIFLDEAEHLLGGRDVGAGGAHAEDRKITSELLVHLTADDRSAIVVGATNRPEDIDPAILRPGRLATHVEIGLPGEESRHAIFQEKLSGVPHDLTGDELALLARSSAGFSGADIEELVTEAKRHAAKRNAPTISLEDFPGAEERKASTENAHPKQPTEFVKSDEEQTDPASENFFDDDSAAGAE